ncbi:MAG TPA: cell surface protein, partial [Planctomycetaceae bacterium]|nr:cell surface protein [Planctomycetaceae bacterium]
DYYSFAAFFAQIGRKRGEDPREIIIFNSGSGEVRHLVGGRVMKPKYLGGETPDTAGKDRRVMVANWLASDKNPYFARNLANIVWAHFMGKGIINEVDDVRVSNPPVNEPLLAELATKFSGYKYDFKKLVRDICVSRTYQLATQTNKTNENDGTNFSHGALRRMRAEVLFDSISQVTDTKNKFGGLPLGARAVQIANGNTSNYFLTTFGRAKRESVCACEVKMEPNLSQALHLLNGDTVNSKIKSGNVLGKLADKGLSPDQMINELYVRCVSRLPTDKEKQTIKAILDTEKDKTSVLEDVFWSLLNSREFLFNH